MGVGCGAFGASLGLHWGLRCRISAFRGLLEAKDCCVYNPSIKPGT